MKKHKTKQNKINRLCIFVILEFAWYYRYFVCSFYSIISLFFYFKKHTWLTKAATLLSRTPCVSCCVFVAILSLCLLCLPCRERSLVFSYLFIFLSMSQPISPAKFDRLTKANMKKKRFCDQNSSQNKKKRRTNPPFDNSNTINKKKKYNNWKFHFQFQIFLFFSSQKPFDECKLLSGKSKQNKQKISFKFKILPVCTIYHSRLFVHRYRFKFTKQKEESMYYLLLYNVYLVNE